ncbi:MAG: hypothetical protein QM811_15980 [Pirellulales bacterium]
MDVRRIMSGMLAAAVVLPIGLCVLFLIWQLLEALGDASGGYWLRRAGLVLLGVWGVDILVLSLLTAWKVSQSPPETPDR